VLDDDYKDGAVAKLGSHKPAGPYRGGKYSIFEGGTRIPLIVRWPGHVKPGVSDAIVSQIDFGASFASMVNQPVPAGALPDSQNVLPALLGQSQQARDHVVEHARVLALRQRNWKYIEPGSAPKRQAATNTELGVASEPQLYDLSKDPGEKENLADKQPQLVQQLAAALDKIKKTAKPPAPL
jgi:arylsulfatase A-like enzyme